MERWFLRNCIEFALWNTFLVHSNCVRPLTGKTNAFWIIPYGIRYKTQAWTAHKLTPAWNSLTLESSEIQKQHASVLFYVMFSSWWAIAQGLVPTRIYGVPLCCMRCSHKGGSFINTAMRRIALADDIDWHWHMEFKWMQATRVLWARERAKYMDFSHPNNFYEDIKYLRTAMEFNSAGSRSKPRKLNNSPKYGLKIEKKAWNVRTSILRSTQSWQTESLHSGDSATPKWEKWRIIKLK